MNNHSCFYCLVDVTAVVDDISGNFIIDKREKEATQTSPNSEPLNSSTEASTGPAGLSQAPALPTLVELNLNSSAENNGTTTSASNT